MIQRKLKNIVMFGVLVAVGHLQGCTNQALYDGAQYSNRNECEKLPPSQYDECVEQAEISFEEYQRQREALLETKPDESTVSKPNSGKAVSEATE